MKILFLTSECVPFVKTGGLADVSGSLPHELSGLGNEIKVFLPLYKSIDTDKFNIKKVENLSNLSFSINDKSYIFSVLTTKHADVEHYFIYCPEFFFRDNIYTNDVDEPVRFIIFQYAILTAVQAMQWSPDIIHCNDWQTALIPELLKTVYSWDSIFNKTKTFLTIHNIAYQGSFPKESFLATGLPPQDFNPGGKYEHYGNFNFLKTGIISADSVGTVSPTYAKEIETPEFGCGLEGVLSIRTDMIIGILNGIDTNIWNPDKDKLIIRNFNYQNISKKKENKQNLLKYCKLEFSEEIPVYGIISRFAWQKGFEIFEPILDDFLKEDIKLVVLGDGEEKYENFFKLNQSKYPDKLFLYSGYNNSLAHIVTAGSDFFIMPSRYEPCGLNQIYSLNYGTIPIVRKTGGLADTVLDIGEYPEDGNGFSFANFDSGELFGKLISSIEIYNNKNKYLNMQKNGMKADYSWHASAKKYNEYYNKLFFH